MLLKKFLIFKRCVTFRNNFDLTFRNNSDLVEKVILFKRGGLLLSCYWCDSRNLCYEIGIGLRSMGSFCINLDEKLRLDDYRYTLYAIKEVPNIQEG